MKKRINKSGFNIETVSLHLKRHIIFYVLVSILFVLLFQNPFSGKNNISNLGPFPDSTLYLNTAKNISLGHGIKINYQESTLDSTIPPLYSITLAPLYTLFKDPRAFYLTNVLFTIMSAIFFYKILLKLFQNKLLITTLFLAFVTNHVIFYYPTVAMPETLLICLYIISIYLFISPVTIRSSIILGFLTTSFIATKYNAWTISFSLFASYTLFLIYRRNEIPALKHFFYYFLSLLVSALFLIALETFSKTGDLSTQLMYYLRYFDSFSNLIFTPQSTPSITNTPEPITFSPSYISNHLFRYFSGLIGGLSSAAGKDLQTIPIIIGIVSTMAVFVNLFTPKFRFISIYLFITFISTLIFISSFFIYDGRYAFALIPIQILVFGLFLNRILDFLSTKKLTTSYWIVLLTCLFGIIINNFQPVQDQILSNLNPDNSGFIGKSGILEQGRNDVGLFTNSSRNTVYFAILLPTGGDESKKKITEILQLLYNSGTTAPAAAPPAAAPPATGAKVNVTECTSPTHKDYCKKTNQTCYLINGGAKCAFPTSATACNGDDTTFCDSKGGCSFETITIVKPDKTEESIKISKCGNNTSAPGAAGTTTRPVTTQPAGAPAAASSTKTPWDNDADNNGSKVIQQIYSRSAAKAGAAAQAARNPTDAATAARKAYGQEFDAAYKELFNGADISKDNDAKTIREKELNNVTVHAYVTKTPGVDWNKAKTDGTVEKAITELKKLGVLPNTVTTASISSPDAPASAGLRQATPTECGYTADGISVPCYKVGVFTSAEDLAATKAQATQATQRYTQNEALLQEIKAKVKSDAAKAAITAAERKNAEAKKNADACLK